jgi:serine carboxypeptidase-like clade 1
LNDKDVKLAIHARLDLEFPWQVCTANISYEESWPSILPIYPDLCQNYRVMVYAGDVTYNVPFQGSAAWIQSLGFSIETAWQAWQVDGQVAGYKISYDSIDFVTVKNAGRIL